ncbi:hypothetical protein BOTBODRAFT_49212 [Botryobasidium botryosum FD-172 SS1]|uniref:Uncharacterized protein n=1 Tax=Botryobasidium botryosum (strain FD-172 SS1) TaxID=930990 RepID=A0A067M559_BOTB1|nr:hypothetical protein BOTBODRAFT_49212 [Botryobasidium botryosum FD-172 SS1]
MPSISTSPLSIPTSPTSSFEVISPTLSQASESFHTLTVDDLEEDEVVWLARSDGQSSVSFSDAELESDDDFILFPSATPAREVEDAIATLAEHITGLAIGSIAPVDKGSGVLDRSAVADGSAAHDEPARVVSTPTMASTPIIQTPLVRPNRELATTPTPKFSRAPFVEPLTPVAPTLALLVESELSTPVPSRPASRTGPESGVPVTELASPATNLAPLLNTPKKKKQRLRKSRRSRKAKAAAKATASAKAAPPADEEYLEAKSYMDTFLKAKTPATDTAARLRLHQALLIELGIASGIQSPDTPSDKASLPTSERAAKALIKTKVFINILDYLAHRTQGQLALQQHMHPSRSALRRDIKSGRKMSLKRVKSLGLNVLLAESYH